MSWTVLGAIVGAALAVVGVGGVAVTTRPHRRPADDQADASDAAAGPADGRPAAPAAAAVSRRVFFERSIIALFAASLAGVATAALAFLWPSLTGARGKRYRIGSRDDLEAQFRSGRPYYDAFGEFYVVRFPVPAVDEARRSYPPPVVRGMELGLVAFSQKCTHLGCKVPFCESSRWFECPCHGSRYNGVGEVERGPAPRGLDHYAVTVSGGEVVVDTRTLYRGPSPGTSTPGEAPAGPHCY